MSRLPRPHARGRAFALALALLAACTAGAPVRAETLRYAIAVPDGQAVTYLLELDVRHAGALSVTAEWSGARSLSLRLAPPDATWGTIHRTGPSPQTLETVVREELGTWTLRVHALAADGEGSGTVTIALPEASPPPSPPPASRPAPAPQPPPEPWMTAQPAPPGTPQQWLPFLDATERLRRTIAGGTNGREPDACQWQVPLLRYLDLRRQSLLERRTPPAESTARVLSRVARTARSVEALRTSQDPWLVGPPPDDARRRDAWLKVRRTRLATVESELDRILTMVRRDYASELVEEPWPARYVSCLTACERYFEQRTLVGDERARNRELARAQWSAILAAADALSALADLTPGSQGGTESASR